MHEAHQSAVIFGLDPVWYAGILFVLTYTLIVAEKLNRAIVAVSAASLMVIGSPRKPRFRASISIPSVC